MTDLTSRRKANRCRPEKQFSNDENFLSEFSLALQRDSLISVSVECSELLQTIGLSSRLNNGVGQQLGHVLRQSAAEIGDLMAAARSRSNHDIGMLILDFG